MHRSLVLTAFGGLLLGSGLTAQTTSSSMDMATPGFSQNRASLVPNANPVRGFGLPDFSHVAIGGGGGPLGINLQAAVNANRYLNIRGVGNFFKYTDSNISSNGFTASGTINLATAGASLDYYPFPNHGFRLSPGALLYNQNGLTATMVAAGGTSFTLNDDTYYSSQTNPVTGTANLGLHAEKVAPTISLGWGNMIPRNGGHMSFPFEVGGAYTGQPSLAMALVSGQVCSDPAGTLNCQNVVGNSSINGNLQAQVAKYQKDVNPLRFYPVISFGVAYSFRIRDVE